MGLQEARENIDALDLRLRKLLMQRLDCSHQVAQAKHDAGSTDVYRADREQAILDTLGKEVPVQRKGAYLPVVRKIMETSRMYQYGVLYDWNPSIFEAVEGHELAAAPSTKIRVKMACDGTPRALGTLLSMIGDYGYDAEEIELLDEDGEGTVLQLLICGDVSQPSLRKLVFQLHKESKGFSIVEAIA